MTTETTHHQVLARKWRPKQFADMVGQQHVLPALINALDHNRLHHAYLFTGTRGVGKTTVARILAKSLNCEQGISSRPCGTCQNCLDIDAGRCLDVMEVDAASRTKVEDTRDLLDNVQYSPTKCRFKIYLIDEVHMLSNHSFNALLKTLEEPPPHVKFLLATTDPQKLPITVLSRCLQFHLKSLTNEQLTVHCETLCREEKIPAEKKALEYIADAAQGSARDALSLLDQAIVFSNNNITEAAVCGMLGQADHNTTWTILENLQSANLESLLAITHDMAIENIDFNQALQQLIEKFHEIAIAQFAPNSLSKDKEKLLNLAKHFSKETVQLYYQILLIGRKDLTLAPTAKLGFEMILLRLLAFNPSRSETTAPQKNTAPAKEAPHAKTPSLKPSGGSSTWNDMLATLQLAGMSQLVASNCSLEKFADNELVLLIDEVHRPLLSANIKDRIQEAVQKNLNQDIKLTIKIGNQTTPTPAIEHQAKVSQRQENAKTSITLDQNIQNIMTSFDGVLEQDSIKSTATDSNK